MNKSEFTRVYADRLGVTIKEAEDYVAKFIDTVTECLENGEYVHISGFATFELKQKQERVGVNPLNSEKIVIPACKSPNVKSSKTYKAYFNK
ncbi:MAG: HU family DNA-binding protein [Clostridia bacterium]|nr:HU family DNA-binding protein [Clostridia bacterium]